MANQLFLGTTKLIDLTGYAEKSWVQSEIANVDVSEQLNNLVEKELVEGSDSRYKVLSDNSFTDALKTKLESLENYDDTSVTVALNVIKSTLADIVSDGSTDQILNTWAEIKSFLSDYTTANDLGDIISNVETTVTSTVETWVGQQSFITDVDASVYALKTEIPTVPTTVSSFTNDAGYLVENDISTYATKNDISTFVTANDVSTFITALDASVYVLKNDVSTLDDSLKVAASAIAILDEKVTADASAIATLNSSVNALATASGNYATANDISTFVSSTAIKNLVVCSSTDYASATKDASTLYIVL